MLTGMMVCHSEWNGAPQDWAQSYRTLTELLDDVPTTLSNLSCINLSHNNW